ncbi:calcium-binding protein [Jannaschia seohaensis]|uniref:Hemolysin type calcium-binding protein n=1 Tax=Jannaschia seohaensis TaxID=475081 RepID=A0A2Y9ARM9_9RHOB|nr:calcium-binding protein [Jannaschia seohaensis]PWJ19316.1 hemolysin type calcium-binding protein [Jannaschia seohaensis]SSA45978.1 Hemolysin-type calcium-binding repeat-containing protein [Jannaschia seohaensis]
MRATFFDLPGLNVVQAVAPPEETPVTPVTLTLVFEEGTTVVSYSDLGSFGYDPAVIAGFDDPPLLGVLIDGEAAEGGLDTEFSVIRVDWSGGSTIVGTFLQEPDFANADTRDLIAITDFVLDGPALPPFDSFEAFLAFYREETTQVGSVPNGAPFGAGSPINLTLVPGVSVETRMLEPDTFSTEFSDDLQGTAGNDVIDGREGQDTIDGGAGADTLIGGPGNDRLVGGDGPDLMQGGAGDDEYVVTERGDRVEDTGGGFDTVRTSVDFSVGISGVETVIATGERDLRLTGSAGDERLTGNGADNILIGGGGQDRMIGGEGADSFVLFGRTEAPFITVGDFDRAEGDRIGIDDQLLGLGGRRTDIRSLEVSDLRALIQGGQVSYDRAANRVEIDTDADGAVDASIELAAGIALWVEDVLIF